MLRNRILKGRSILPFAKHMVNGAVSPAHYRVTVLARPDDVPHLSALAQALLRNTPVIVVHSAMAPASSLTRFALVVTSTVSERAALSRMVGQLGLEHGVRSVQWESIPCPTPRNICHR
ncbi:protein of unknown function (plasmid) [Cupriavidus taiwanensis]|uniref:ACT domain-containing protein n=1 Tax=Cupriavidus taiwanensis TaxID=164546 RepID=A0A375I7B6_9BURK|nr:hypothetical protein [Cupriavidus taiwanensis]SPK69930.1 hypothetical protein CT19425_U230017 [Cupriavidus taiwanensis]SPK70165.1 hypothetical protein CT19425_U380019 [Cupriavidus taiwanensis]SPK77704.1 protein of unknown function [Cupriavidus taiwanensis]